MRIPALAAALLLVSASQASSQQRPAGDRTAAVDAVFANFLGNTNPGCAVGVSQRGQPVLTRAYGMAELEHDTPNRPETVFEAGSVAKQFTAAAIILLAQEGKLSLEDDIRRYLPELPDYGRPITIRHLITHTSGLRDWGSVAAITGWPRTTRIHDHHHVLDIASRQRALNYTPGEFYSYTNTGYNLQAIIVERVSGMPFAEFSRIRIFEPLGLTSTQWRDDFMRVVKGRAVAYRRGDDGAFRMDMPFEQVHGNGGLLTTVGDLLRWTEALERGAIGGEAFVAEMHRQMRLNSGREISYAGGLMVGEFRGVPEVGHSGSTAGYRAHLMRFPREGVAVAVLCNAAHGGATALARQVAEIYLGDALAPETPPTTARVPASVLEARAGVYRDTRAGWPLALVHSGGELRTESGQRLVPTSATTAQAGGAHFVFQSAAAGRRAGLLRIAGGDTVRYEPVEPFRPTAAQLGEFAGRYHSDEAETYLTAVVQGGSLVLQGRYGRTISLTPAYPDAFVSSQGMYRFHRDAAGRVMQMSAVSDRVWDMRFDRVR